jgi:hypothetical protein
MIMLYKRSVQARELPAQWREEGRFAPDDRVTVVITPERGTAAGSPKRFVGAGKGLFGSGEDVDAYLRRQRDAWTS